MKTANSKLEERPEVSDVSSTHSTVVNTLHVFKSRIGILAQTDNVKRSSQTLKRLSATILTILHFQWDR